MKENIKELQNKKYLKNINGAIKVYEEFRRHKNDGFIESIDPDFFFNLTDVILSDYKRVLKENEQLRTEVNSLKNSIPKERIEKKREELIKLKQRNIKRNFDTVYKDGYFTGGADALFELLEEK